MLQPPSTWTWTAQRERAAVLVADNTHSDEQIATELGVARMTILRWRQHPAFAERVADLVEAYRVEVQRRGIAERQNRVDALNDRWQKMQDIIAARAASMPADESTYDPFGLTNGYRDQAKAAGFDTGLLTLEWTGMFANKPNFKLDAALLKEMRETERQAAQELGQWNDGSSNETTVVIKQIIGIDRDLI